MIALPPLQFCDWSGKRKSNHTLSDDILFEQE
jgi:hypothetical protein